MPAKDPVDQPLAAPAEGAGLEARFPELAEIQREIELRIRDNKRFLERFMDEDFAEEDDEDDENEAPEDEPYEEL